MLGPEANRNARLLTEGRRGTLELFAETAKDPATPALADSLSVLGSCSHPAVSLENTVLLEVGRRALPWTRFNWVDMNTSRIRPITNHSLLVVNGADKDELFFIVDDISLLLAGWLA